MTREEAIKVLEPFKACMFDQHGCPISDAAIALDVAIEALSEPQIVRCGECKHKIEHHYEEQGENPYIKSTCGNKYGLSKGYQVHDWSYCCYGNREEDE